MANENEGSGFLFGFTVGALMGAALGVLLAPRPGEETRAQLREQSARLREQARERFPEFRERAEELAARARDQIPEIRERAEELAALARARGQAAVEGLWSAAGKQATSHSNGADSTEPVAEEPSSTEEERA